MASTRSRPTLAVLPVVSPTRRQCSGDVRGHVTVNTNQVHSQVVSQAQSAFKCPVSKDTLIVYQQPLRQHEDERGQTQSLWNCLDKQHIILDSCHSVDFISPSTSSSTSTVRASSSSRRVMLGRCAERRRVATERERRRLQRVNAAFDLLRERTCCHVINYSVAPRPLPGHRLSKLAVLRRAISYIEHLEHLLDKNVHVTRARNVSECVGS